MPLVVDAVLRIVPATILATLALSYAAKESALRARDGRSPVHRGASGGSQRAGRRMFEIFRAYILIVMIGRVFWPPLGLALVPIPVPGGPTVEASIFGFGVAFMLVGVWLLFYSHSYMGALWRSGVPSDAELERGPDALLQRGPFERTRNPIFLSVLVIHLGLTLTAPSVVLALSLCICAIALRRQALVEEDSLRRRFGPSYDAYCARTPRWV